MNENTCPIEKVEQFIQISYKNLRRYTEWRGCEEMEMYFHINRGINKIQLILGLDKINGHAYDNRA